MIKIIKLYQRNQKINYIVQQGVLYCIVFLQFPTLKLKVLLLQFIIQCTKDIFCTKHLNTHTYSTQASKHNSSSLFAGISQIFSRDRFGKIPESVNRYKFKSELPTYYKLPRYRTVPYVIQLGYLPYIPLLNINFSIA